MVKAKIGGALRLFAVFTILVATAAAAQAQDNRAAEAAHRHAVLAQLPPDAAKRLFGLALTPAPPPAGMPAQSIGSYARGCIAGAVALPADGPNWQVMRPSRDRAWGRSCVIVSDGPPHLWAPPQGQSRSPRVSQARRRHRIAG